MAEGYRGLPGAYVYAFRQSGSYLYQSYVVTSALVVAFLAILFTLALITWIANPAGLIGDRAFLAVIAILLVLPLMAPVLLGARRHRMAGDRQRPRADRLLGIAGYALVIGIWLAIVIAAPAGSSRPGPFSPVVTLLYSLPTATAVVPPLVAIALFWAIARRTRPF